MDKTFNDLMDIVNRTRKIDELEGGNRPKRIVREVEPDQEESVEKAPRPSLFEPDAIKKFLNKEKEEKTKKTTKKTSKKSTKKSTKKTTTKSGAKTTKTKKTTTKTTGKSAVDKTKKANEIAEKFKLIKDKEVVKPSKVPALDMSDPKNVELYNALKETLFAGGTDVSDYMPKDSNPAVTASKLNELFTKKKSKDDYASLTQEQREYEQLFTGSFLGDNGNERHGEMSDDDLQKVLEKQSTESEFAKDNNEENNEATADLDNSNVISDDATSDTEESAENDNESKPYANRFDRDLEEYNSRDRDLDEKIAEYYKRKNEKINEYNTKIASDEENEVIETTDEYSDKQRDYADIFSGSMTEREEVLAKDEVVEETNEEDNKPKDFGTIYRELNSGDYDDDDRFITPSSEKIGGDEYVTVKESVEDSKKDTEETDVENETEIEVIDNESDDENLDYSKQSFKDDEMMDEEEPDDKEDIYDLSSEDSDLDDYIVSSNIPVEKENDGESNTMVMTPNQLPETKFDVLGEEVEKEEDNNSDAISKQEFYNEMARLQENLLNELKSESKPKETEPVSTDNATLNKALDIISQLALSKNEDKNAKDVHAEKVADDLINEIDKDMKVSRLMGEDNTIEDAILNEVSSAKKEENQVEEKEENSESVFENLDKKESEVSPVETYTGDSLLNADVALNEDDLEYLVNSEKLKAEKSENFYLSEGDKESRADIQASTTTPKSVEPFKEMGDLNLNKDINNAVSTKEEIETKEKLDTEVAQTPKDDDMELIYTLFGIQKKKMENKQNEIKVLFVASESQPFIATGGLGDVVGSLPKAIAKVGGVDMRVILPLYSKIKNEYKDKLEYICNFTVHLSWRQEYCGLFRYVMDGVTYYFVDNERYFKRPQPYGYYDDGERFGYFCKAVVESLPMLDFFPDIIHCNDWQSALVSTYIKTGNWSDFRYYKIKNIYTIHNVEYQGVYGMENLKDLFGVDTRFKNDLEYNGDINLTKAAIQFSDKFTTVSESYCDNLKQPYCSKGLNHIIVRNEYKLCGIINGIDYDFYNPKTDKIIYKNYDENSLDDKVFNKKIWQDELGLPVDATTPMLAVVSRLVSHKGMDLLTKVLEDLLNKDIQLVVVGTGEQRYVDYFKYLEGKYPTKVRALVDKYSNENARKAYASSDIFLMPSKVEPCGISQMIASRYGSVPVVREVGGLKDSIKDFGCENGGNGYTFASYNPNDLKNQITRAIDDYHDTPNWKKKMYTVMTTNFTWEKSAHKYIDLYKSLID